MSKYPTPDHDGWMPIETAPRNTHDILITKAGIGEVVRIGFWDEALGGRWSIWPGREQMFPTHWQPLPAPPALHTFNGNAPGVVGADNCQICGRWFDEPETDTCRDFPTPPVEGA